MWTTNNLLNESDVEQKFIYPLLTLPQPNGLGIPLAEIQTKGNIRRFNIGKGRDKKLYYPDYVCTHAGLPILVIEAKAPGTELDEAYREARLYANELNALWDVDINPTKFVAATNGLEMWSGFSDQSEPAYKHDLKDSGVYSQFISDIVELFSWNEITKHSAKVQALMRPSGAYKPRRLLGGKSIQNQELSLNEFGVSITSSISYIINPQTISDRELIVSNAYVSSKRRERYIEPIDRVVRVSKPVSETKAKRLDDTAEPNEIVSQLERGKELEHQVLLMVGGVGSGKTTFIDYLKFVALKEHSDTLSWLRINMNNAPVNREEIYRWIREKIIEECINELKGYDLSSLDEIQKIFSVEINKFKRIYGPLYGEESAIYKEKLGEEIQRLLSDLHAKTTGYLRYCCGDKGKLAVIVLDNCDKKNRDEQLLMFEVSQWIREEFKCLVVLPLRDETFDNHRDQPPLDTVLKDMVFRIEPPLFQHVLFKRIQLALSKMKKEGEKRLSYGLPNGFHVEYPQSDQAFYLTSILKSLFEHDRFARRMIVGLAGRNIRRALELFIEFCNSGYIGEDEILKIRSSEGKYSLPFHKVATVLIRMNKRYYDGDESFIKNLFSASHDAPTPAYFSRLLILRFLKQELSNRKYTGIRGYISVDTVKEKLTKFGYPNENIDKELRYLVNAKCIITEHLREDNVSDDDLIRLGPAGYVHLDLLHNVMYLSAVSEDTNFLDRETAESIKNRIVDPETHLHIKNNVANAKALVSFLKSLKNDVINSSSFLKDDFIFDNLSDLSECEGAIERVERSASEDPWFNADKTLKRGEVYKALITNSEPYGFFAEFDIGITGLIHKTKLNNFLPSIGDKVSVKVDWVDVIQRKMSLELLEILEEEADELNFDD